MPGDVENLIQGVGFLYAGAFGATEPDDNQLHLPPPTGVWTPLGFTQEGVTIAVEQEYSELEVDQIVDIPGQRLIKRSATLATSLAEPTLANLRRTLNQTGTINEEGASPGAQDSGVHTFEPDSGLTNIHPTYQAFLFDGIAPGGLVRRIILRRGLQVGDQEQAYTKDGQTVFACEFTAHWVSSSIRPWKIVDQVAVPSGS